MLQRPLQRGLHLHLSLTTYVLYWEYGRNLGAKLRRPLPLHSGKRPYQEETLVTVSAMNIMTGEMVTDWNERASRYTSLHVGRIVHYDWGGCDGG